MKMRKSIVQVLLVSICLVAGSWFSIHAQDQSVMNDLFTVITLNGHNCGQVTSYKRLGDNDYIVICKTGDRYHVYVSPDERVIVEKK